MAEGRSLAELQRWLATQPRVDPGVCVGRIPWLHYLALTYDAHALRWFIDTFHPNVNLLCSSSFHSLTALFYCTTPANARVLIEAGIDVNFQRTGASPAQGGCQAIGLHAWAGRIPLVLALLELGGNPYAAQRGLELGYESMNVKAASTLRSYILRWNHCRLAARALLALRKRLKSQRDILYLLARYVWGTRAHERWYGGP